jgi:GTP diphosphokinase / guanosine-3',5'-bis(diphosphate) 3'-diphosphatase
MPSAGNAPLNFNRDRNERQLDARLEELLAKLRKNRPSEDPWLVRRAYEIAAERHRTQVRRSGEPYLMHLLEVAHILADMRLDATTLTAALLHDVIEDTEFPVSRIEERFGAEVAHLVEGVTKISRLNMMAPEARQAENVRKMVLAMVHDVRVVLVKLADRLHNMRTLEYLESAKQQRISRETLDIYAPIAHRLGMGIIRNELEDLSFRYLEPESFLALQKEVTDKTPIYLKFLEEVQATIRTKLVEGGIPAELAARVKGLYSLHRKIIRQERSLEQVYDLLAVRVITDNERNCYAALGVMHHIWRPVPGRFKDYIAMPRPNLYQSLHTTVIHNGQPFEVQIRTQEMHHMAEEGVAAHWKYKDDKPASEDDQRITWMRQLIEWSQELEEPSEFLSTLKVDLAPVEVYAFTPKGRVLELPRGATPVDFAYTVHTEVGHQCVGAKVNGQMVALRHEIVSGDVVEILTQKGHKPSRDWLSFVKSSHARTKIKHWINVQEREEATEMGTRLLEKEARQFGRSLKKIPEEDLLKLASDYGLSKLEDLYAAVGFGKYSARQVLTRVLGEPAKGSPPAEEGESKPTLVKTVKRMLGFGEAPLIVKGHDDLLVYRAKCCNPIPGDDIIGYITRGRGVAVHTRTCPNVQNLLYQTERRIPVEWGGAGTTKFLVHLVIRAKDRAGLLADITAVFSNAGCNIHNLESRPDKLNAQVDVNLEIIDRRQLESILASVRKIAGVYGVERVYQT